MPSGQVVLEDPHARHRRIAATLGGLALALSGLFVAQFLSYQDGSHGPLVAIESWPRTAILVAIGALGAWFGWHPERPDPRIAQAAMLAVAVVAVVVGLNNLVAASIAPAGADATALYDARAGPATWLQLFAAGLFLYLRWRRSLWPESRWAAQFA